MSQRIVAIGMLVIAFLLAEGAFAFPFVPQERVGNAVMMPEAHREFPAAPTRSVVPPPVGGWPGLAVVDFRGWCITVYVLRLARPLERPIDPQALLLSMREGAIPQDLDAILDAKSFLYPFAFPTAFFAPTGPRERLAIGAVFPGGHNNHFHSGEGSVLMGTFYGFDRTWPSYLIESTSATIIDGSARGWFPLEAKFSIAQTFCD